MLGKDGLAGTPCSTIAVKCGFGWARPPGEPPNDAPVQFFLFFMAINVV